MRKGVTKLTGKDFEEFPIWELQHSFTHVEPYKGEIPFKAHKFRAFFVRTRFTLADKTKLIGWTMICLPPYETHSLSPTILTDTSHINLTKIANGPDQKAIDEAFRRIGKPAKKVFPLRFETDVPIPEGPATGEMTGFVHQLEYKDDRGLPRYVYCTYQSAGELDAAVKNFNQKEAAGKAPTEPSDEEMDLLKAVKEGDANKVKLCLSKQVNLNRGGTVKYGDYTRKDVTPLMLAAETGSLEVLQILLKAGADIHLVDSSNQPRQGGKSALAYAYKECTEATHLLLEAGANPNQRLAFGHTLFDEVCYDGKKEIILLFLTFGADPNASCGKSLYFALERAVSANRLDVAQLLLKHKADINGADIYGETVLMKACQSLLPEIVRFLLENGADVTPKAPEIPSALEIVVANAARLNPQRDKDTAEKFPAAIWIARALVEKGADVHAKGIDGKSLLSLAEACRFPELSAYLKSKRAK